MTTNLAIKTADGYTYPTGRLRLKKTDDNYETAGSGWWYENHLPHHSLNVKTPTGWVTVTTMGDLVTASLCTGFRQPPAGHGINQDSGTPGHTDNPEPINRLTALEHVGWIAERGESLNTYNHPTTRAAGVYLVDFEPFAAMVEDATGHAPTDIISAAVDFQAPTSSSTNRPIRVGCVILGANPTPEFFPNPVLQYYTDNTAFNLYTLDPYDLTTETVGLETVNDDSPWFTDSPFDDPGVILDPEQVFNLIPPGGTYNPVRYLVTHPTATLTGYDMAQQGTLIRQIHPVMPTVTTTIPGIPDTDSAFTLDLTEQITTENTQQFAYGLCNSWESSGGTPNHLTVSELVDLGALPPNIGDICDEIDFDAYFELNYLIRQRITFRI